MRTLKFYLLIAVALTFCCVNTGQSEIYPVGGVFVDESENAAHASPPIELARQYDEYCDNSITVYQAGCISDR